MKSVDAAGREESVHFEAHGKKGKITLMITWQRKPCLKIGALSHFGQWEMGAGVVFSAYYIFV